MNRPEGEWIQTYTGKKVWPLTPFPEDFDINDIAHALSLQCRYTGHVRVFYSVAQHSVLVSQHCDTEDAFWGLMHDSTEAYLIDLARPVKHNPKMSFFREAEDKLMEAIADRYGLSLPMPPSVKRADNALLLAERRDLMVHIDWPETAKRMWDAGNGAQALEEIINPWSPEEAESAFLTRFKALYKFSMEENAAGVQSN